MHEEMGRWPWDPFASPTKPASDGQTDASVQGGAALQVHAHGTVVGGGPAIPRSGPTVAARFSGRSHALLPVLQYRAVHRRGR